MSLKILNLVLYSDNKIYNKMKYLLEKYYKHYKNVKTIFYKFTNTIEEEYQLQNNILNIKGIETYIPGILDKTIKAFEFFKNDINNYDYIIRSNISTIINFGKLEKILLNKKYDYGLRFWENNIEIENNNIKEKLPYFASGTSILFSPKLLNFIIDNKQLINYNLIDDVSIGEFIYKHYKEPINLCNLKSYYIANRRKIGKNKIIICKLITKEIVNKYIIFRNHCGNNRNFDVIRMNSIIKILEKNLIK